MKIWIYGTGQYYQYYKKWIKQECIAGFIDRDSEKQLRGVDGHRVISPEDVDKVVDTEILVLVKEYGEVVEKLKKSGIDENSIITYEELNKNNWTFFKRIPIEVFGEINSREDAILCLTHNMDITGAEVALLETVKIFIEQGKHVYVVSASDGRMREEFTKERITVIIDPNLLVDDIHKAEWMDLVHPVLLFLNTVYTYSVLWHLDKDTRIIWWLHDPSACYRDITRKSSELIKSFTNLEVVAVSDIAKKNFLDNFSGVEVGILPFGMEDFFNKRKKHDGIIFAIIGNVCVEKGTDTVLEAIERIGDSWGNNNRLWVIGRLFENEFCKRIEIITKEKDYITLWGEVSRETLMDLYQEIDILICASAEETLSAVAIEAMMNCIPCIVSDHTGIADYIENGRNGYVFETQNIDDLSLVMNKTINNTANMGSMALNARDVYKKNFASDRFCEKVLSLISKKI